jgi:lysophospholipase L1-like esterase
VYTVIWAVRLAAIGALCFLTATGTSARSAARSSQPDAVVIGDSLGIGVAVASGLTRLARISVHIRGPKALQQIASAPVGSTAFVVLGSNDAEGDIRNLDRSIDAIVHAAENKNMRLVWLGPPCVRRSWNGRSLALDQMLKARFANTSVTYVSMHDDTLCSGRFFEPDGVHLTMKGYGYMWEKARHVAGFGSPDDRTAVVIKTTDRPAETAAVETDHRLAVANPAKTDHRAPADAAAAKTRHRAVAILRAPNEETSPQTSRPRREPSPHRRTPITRPATISNSALIPDDRFYPRTN